MESVPDYDRLRKKMVKSQLKHRGIRSKKVLQVMLDLPRHLYVPENFRKNAYEDKPLSIECDQTISQPYMVALMTEILQIKPEDTVLEIGTGSGYQAAVLASLCKKVISIERHQSLAHSAHATLKEQGFNNVFIRVGDGSLGAPDEAPFDAIIVTAGSPELPDSLKHQLKPGGRMVCPVGDKNKQDLIIVTRKDTQFKTKKHSRCRFVPLVGKEGWNE